VLEQVELAQDDICQVTDKNCKTEDLSNKLRGFTYIRFLWDPTLQIAGQKSRPGGLPRKT